MSEHSDAVVLAVDDLRVIYHTPSGEETAVDGVTFVVPTGRIVALVGESGSGKTTVAKTIGGLLPGNAHVDASSSVSLAGVDILNASEPVLRSLRGTVVGFVPQDPRRSLHPLKRIGDQIGEVLLQHRLCTRSELAERVGELLVKVGIDPGRARQYPHEFSGGMLQRALIAVAIAARPSLVIADEPTSALDVTVQKQILTLLTSIVKQDGVSILLITHDLELVAEYADETIVMNHGRVVETAPTADLFASPLTDYTRLLIGSSPQVEPRDPRLAGTSTVLGVRSLVRELRVDGQHLWSRGQPFRAVDDVTFDLAAGRTLAVVGESGAGKTTLARLALGLDRPSEGEVLFEGRNIHALDAEGRRAFRRGTHVVPQNPASSFDPRYSVSQVIAEPLVNARMARQDIRFRVAELLDQVGLPADYARRSALELSGGQQQRVAIARAISLKPRLVVCDEPTSALDVTVQARILALLQQLQDEIGVSYLFISHDLAVVSAIADDILVLRAGRVVEHGSAHQVLTTPTSDYTRELLNSVPSRPAAAPSEPSLVGDPL